MGVLAALVEDHDGVIQRVTKNRQESDHRCRCDLEAGEGVDANGDHEVVRQGDQRCQRHLPRAEVRRQDDRNQDQEPDESRDGLLADRSTPGRSDRGGRDLVLADLELAHERGLDLGGQGVLELLGVDSDRVRADLGHHDIGACGQRTDGCLAPGLEVVHVGHRGDPELRPSPELQADVEATAEQTDAGQDEQHQRHGVPGLLAANDVEGAFAAVELVTELGEAAHDWFPSAAARRAAMVTRPRPAYVTVLAPSRSGSSPDHLCPSPKNFVLARIESSGWVNNITTTMSMIVVSINVNANPRTLLAANTYRTTAARKLTASAVSYTHLRAHETGR